MKDLTTRDQLAILGALADIGTVTPVSLELTGDVPYEKYEAIMRMLGVMGHSIRWWTGDGLVYGEGAFKDKMEQAALATNLSEGTLLNYRWVCERVTKSRRRVDVSFSCHQEVAPLPPGQQRHWLAVCAREGLTQRELRARIKGAIASGEAKVDEGVPTEQPQWTRRGEQLDKLARDIWRHAQEDGDGWWRVPGELMAQLRSIVGEE